MGEWCSPVQGAPASCRPGDGPDIASPLSSEKKDKKDACYYWVFFHESIKVDIFNHMEEIL